MKKTVAFLFALIFLLQPKRVKADDLVGIMGTGELSAENMYLYLIENNKETGINPISEEYAKGFIILSIQEAEAEGVRSDVAFCLMMHETGFLNYGGDVAPDQNNFGGLGTTGGGVTGASFDDPRLGVRAVVQHLKCYATDEATNLPLTDPRWNEKLRGKAPYVQYLGYADNPNGSGWAVPGDGYGEKILSMIDQAKALDTSDVAAIDVPSYDPSAPDVVVAAMTPIYDSATRNASSAQVEQESAKDPGFPLSLLQFNAENVVNFTVALLLFFVIVGLLRFRSRYI